MPKLRIGIGDVLDARPLAWGFFKGHHADQFEPVHHPVPLIAPLLDQEVLDVGLLPATDLAGRGDHLVVLPDLCVHAAAGGRSPVVLSRVPWPEVERILVGRGAWPARAALQVLLAERYGIEPELVAIDPAAGSTPALSPETKTPGGTPIPRLAQGGVPMADALGSDLWGRLDEREALCLDGASALPLTPDDLDRDGLFVLFLGKEWFEHTGHPLVLHLWAARASVDLPDLPFYFKSSLRSGLSALTVLAREAAAAMELDSVRLETYLREDLGYFLREPALAGLEDLLTRGRRHGLLEAAGKDEGEGGIRLWAG